MEFILAIPLAFSVDVSQTLETYCGHIEDVHVGFDGARINFDRITV